MSVSQTIFEKRISSPVGPLHLMATDEGLIAAHFTREAPSKRAKATHPVLALAEKELEEYFSGQRKEFTVPLAARGTEFQRRVWQALSQIPYGELVSYAQIAQRVKSAQAMRAVGAANGRNPIPIIVPCHRVIGANGSLVGYGGGLERKRWLLDHEGRVGGALLF